MELKWCKEHQANYLEEEGCLGCAWEKYVKQSPQSEGIVPSER